MIAAVALSFALLIAATGAVQDIRSRRIPNLLCLALAVAAAASLAFSADIMTVLGAALHGAIALIIGMVLFRFGMIGGGDAKFYAAAALGIPLDRALPMIGWTSLGGLVLLMALMLVFAVKRKVGGPRDKKGRVLLPYGVAIFIGFACTMGGTLGFVLPV